MSGASLRFSRVLALVVLVSAFGCGGAQVTPTGAPEVRVRVAAHPRANQGRSVRMIVRQLDDVGAFVADDYAAMARLAAAPDDSVLADRFLRPSSTLEVTVRPEAEKAVGVYVFLSAPRGSKWKIRSSEGQSDLQLVVLEHEVRTR